MEEIEDRNENVLNDLSLEQPIASLRRRSFPKSNRPSIIDEESSSSSFEGGNGDQKGDSNGQIQDAPDETDKLQDDPFSFSL